ncbi:unnamed protein product [Laminaria digitata]
MFCTIMLLSIRRVRRPSETNRCAHHHRATPTSLNLAAAHPLRSITPLHPITSAAIKVDKENMDYNKLRVKQLKGILADRGVDCDGCLEKSDYVARCKATEHLEL